MAEHFYNILATQLLGSDSSPQIKLADLLCEMGQQLLQDGQHDLAAKWLGRARVVIEQAQYNCVVMDAQDLRLNILHTYGEPPAWTRVSQV